MSQEALTHKKIEKAIQRSQHCQRNWDLEKKIPKEDLDLLVTSVTQCPSKQNISFYSAHFIMNRDLIEEVHSYTDGFTISYDPPASTTNTQVLANLLVAFEAEDIGQIVQKDPKRNMQTYSLNESEPAPSMNEEELLRDQNMAVGIAAGYLNLSAALMGYGTGCCLCFDGAKVEKALGLKNRLLLLMGIGFKNPSLGRRIHHLDHSFAFPTKRKQPIKTSFIS